MNIIIFGPPGSGKGTYSSRIAPKLGIIKVSTGDLFREHVANKTELGKKAEEYMNKGHLVPDELTIEMLKERISQKDAKNGVIFDGFPRTLPQAEALDKITKIDLVINLIMPREILIQKMLARRICRKCGDIYNIADIHETVDGVEYILPPMNPKVPGKCDKCGGELYKRDDETEEVIKDRFEVYDKQSKPVIDYYRKKDVPFVNVHVTRGPEIMTGKIMDELKPFLK